MELAQPHQAFDTRGRYDPMPAESGCGDAPIEPSGAPIGELSPGTPAIPGVVELLASEIIHRTANDLAFVSTTLQALRRETFIARREIDALVDRLVANARINRLLMAPRVHEAFDFSVRLSELCAAHSHARFAPEGVSLSLTIDADEAVERNTAWRLLLCVSELLVNIGKYAVPRGARRISVSIASVGGQLHCLVVNDGTASTRQRGNELSYGTALISSMLAEVHGKLEIQHLVAGMSASIFVPIARQSAVNS